MNMTYFDFVEKSSYEDIKKTASCCFYINLNFMNC